MARSEFNDFKRSNTPRSENTAQTSVKNQYHGIYIGKVKENKDISREGRIKVHIPELCGDPSDSKSWIRVQYVSPFAGSSPPTLNKAGGKNSNQSQVSYGMWCIPPDLENDVIVCFINGNPNQGIYICCLYQTGMNHSVPAIGIAVSQQKGVKLDGKEINPPTAEYNKRDLEQDPENPERPRAESLHQGLYNQGLYADADRGPSNASARREAPSQVFGFSTPRGHNIHIDDGEIEVDPTTGEPLYADNQVVKKSLTNEYIRLRTRHGTQIVVNDTLGYVYINSRQGNSWFEISDEGINLYTSKNFNVRCQGDMNIRVDGNLNQEVIGTTNWRNGGNFNGQYESDLNLSIIPGGGSSGGNNELRISAKGEIFINSDDSITVDARNQLIHKTSTLVQKANAIHHNSYNVSGGKAAQGPEKGATRDRQLTGPGYPEGEVGGGSSILPARGLITHEPWNYHQKVGSPNTSENSIGNVRKECPPAGTQPGAEEANASAASAPGADSNIKAGGPAAADPRIESQSVSDDERALSESVDKKRNILERRKALEEREKQNNERAREGQAQVERLLTQGKIQEANALLDETGQRFENNQASIELQKLGLEAEYNAVVEKSSPVSARLRSTLANSAVTSGRLAAPVGRNPNSISGPIQTIINDGQARAANIIDEFSSNAVQLSGRLNESVAAVTNAVNIVPNVTKTALAAAENAATTFGTRVIAPGIRTFENIFSNYTQNLEKNIITLKNGAVLTDALKPVTVLSTSTSMLNNIRAEYPFRETITTIKNTGVQIIGYGTQLTEDLANHFSGGVKMAAGEAEELLRGRIGEVENTIKSIVTVPMTQNQFDSVVSLGEHIGPQALANSDMIPAINSGNVQAAINDFECYTNGGELAPRRRAEAGNYANGGEGSTANNPNSGFTPKPVAGSGKLTKGTPTADQITAIDRAAERTGVSREALFGFAAQESAFNDSAKAGTSSATGLMQFTNSTWNDMVGKYGTEYGLTPSGRNDPNQSAMAAALYMKENQRTLERSIGRPVTTTDLYAAHFLGAGGGARILKASGNAVAADVALPKQVAANKTVFFDKSGRARTVDEVYGFMQQKVEAPGITYASAFPQGSGTRGG